ncbi:spore photoproduct [Clostridium perfringens]|uniref:spore photoproduct n=1 Tax=Clostridium perfringens TaxID=1502 RepID=UPI00096A5C05|nr:spore photoproduct [Clostridium perfringens]MCX0357574.1 spore photoproduct [Clostridium perfringens]MCX0420316.1 spore photoproduct [Clostridium perfringens]
MKYKKIEVEEVLIEFQNCLKVIKDEDEAFDYFADLIEDKLEDDAYIYFVSDDIIQIRFERETNKSTFKYVVDFYKKYIEYNSKITNFCDVRLVLVLEDFLINENGESYNSEEFTFDELKNNYCILKMSKLNI